MVVSIVVSTFSALSRPRRFLLTKHTTPVTSSVTTHINVSSTTAAGMAMKMIMAVLVSGEMGERKVYMVQTILHFSVSMPTCCLC